MFYNRISNTKSKVLCPEWINEQYTSRPRDFITKINEYITNKAYIDLTMRYGQFSYKKYGDYMYFVSEIDAMAVKLFFS